MVLDAAGLDEPALVERARRGDARAFCALVAAHQVPVRVYIATRLRDPDAADDLAQDVFVRAFKGLDTYRPDAPLRAWLLGIARNRLLEHVRQSLRQAAGQRRTTALALGDHQAAAMESEDPEARQREVEALKTCVERLPPHGASLVAQHYFEGLPLAEIAERAGRKQSAVRMTLLRLRETLRECMRRQLAEGAP